MIDIGLFTLHLVGVQLNFIMLNYPSSLQVYLVDQFEVIGSTRFLPTVFILFRKFNCLRCQHQTNCQGTADQDSPELGHWALFFELRPLFKPPGWIIL